MSDNPRRPSNTLRTILSFNSDDLTNPSKKQKYPLGLVISLDDVEPNPLNTASSTSNVETKYMYVFNKGGVGLHRPGLVEHSVEIGEEYFIETATTEITTASVFVVVPQITIPINEYGFCLFEGYGLARVTGTSNKNNILLIDETFPNVFQRQVAPSDEVISVNSRAVTNVNTTGIDKLISVCLIARQGGVRL